jgi:ketosteroid isomerase-like protein
MNLYVPCSSFRSVGTLLLCVFGATLAIGAEPVVAAQRSAAQDEQEIRRIEAEITRAVMTQDPATFMRLLGDDYTTVSATGLFRTKADVVEDARKKTAGAQSTSIDDVIVRLYGDTAVVTAIRTNVGGVLRGANVSGRLRTLRVYARRGAEWQAVAFQMTMIANKK